MKMSKEDLRALKALHRLESVMMETGERFDSQWQSTTTNGLKVDPELQIYQVTRPGMDIESGDVYSWLMRSYGWSFGMALRYLKSRPADDQQRPVGIVPAEDPKRKPAAYPQSSYESEYPDKEKEDSGLFECGVSFRDGKHFYVYIPRPADAWQEKALDIGGEEMRKCFALPSWEIAKLRDSQYTRFIPVQDTLIEDCEECGKPIDWFWTQPPNFAYKPIPGSGSSWEKVRIYPEPQVFAYLVDEGDDSVAICEDCKRKHINFYVALDCLYRSARKREAPERERRQKAEQEEAQILE